MLKLDKDNNSYKYELLFQRWLTEQRQQCPHCRYYTWQCTDNSVFVVDLVSQKLYQNSITLLEDYFKSK